MNPYGVSGGLFATQANQAANGFSNPISPAYMGGGWGIDPSMMTPSYDAPYRPKFNGPSPYAAYQKPGFFGALNQSFGPTTTLPYWGSPSDHLSSAATTIGNAPIDGGMWTGQRFIAPAIAYGLSQKILTGSYGFSAAMSGGGFAGRVGGAFGRGIATGAGFSAGGMAAGAAGTIGGLAAGVALPYAGMMTIMKVAEDSIFQPYARMRQINEDIRNNFSNVTFNDTKGSMIAGRGIDRVTAANMSSQLDSAGIRDMTWSASQFQAIGSMSMRSGLLDGSNSGQIVSQIKGISEQVKMIVAISKDPSVQSAIEELSKLQHAGASIKGGSSSDAARIYRQISSNAAIAGMSVQQMMAASEQGQYMYGMNGLTPALGALAASNAHAGFAGAYRNNVMSSAQFARMGGVAGATQSFLAGNLAGMQTPFSQMMQANKYLYGGGTNHDLTNVLSQFGENAAKDPLKMIGGQLLYGKAMASAESNEGWSSLQKKAIPILKSLGISPGEDGRYAPEHIALAWRQMGLTEDQIQAGMAYLAQAGNTDVYAQKIKAISGSAAEEVESIIYQEALGNGYIDIARRTISENYKAFTDNMSGISAWWNKTGAQISTATERIQAAFTYGTAMRPTASSFSDAINQVSGGKGTQEDTLELIQQAAHLRKSYADGKENPKETIMSKLQDPKYAALRKSLEGMSPSQMWSKIEDITGSAMKTGILGTSFAYQKGMSINDLERSLDGKLVSQLATNPGTKIDARVFDRLSEAMRRETLSKLGATSEYNDNKTRTEDFTKQNKNLDELGSAAKDLKEAAQAIKGGPLADGKRTPNAWQRWMYGDGENQNKVGGR